MLPPTYLTCLEVGQYADPGAVLEAAHGRRVEMFMPEVEETPDGGVLTIPRAAGAVAGGRDSERAAGPVAPSATPAGACSRPTRT